MEKRIELLIYNNKKIEDININRNIGSVYIKVNLNNLSKTRKVLIENNYTTRLMVINEKYGTIFYIYGKKQKNKGVFNEHCKNSLIKEENYIKKIIEVSSNENDIIETDDLFVVNEIKKQKRIENLND